jgi:hypothetical protein
MRLRYYWRKMFNGDYKLLSETAYHEAGHVCISYLAGFTVDNVYIDADRPGNGSSAINFGTLQDVVHALFALDKTAAPFNALSSDRKSKSKATAHKLTDSLVGGPIAEARFKALRDKKENMEVIVEHSDYKMSLTIESSLNNLLSHYQKTVIPEHTKAETERVSEIMTLDEIWNSIDRLAKGILNSSNFRLEKTDIEKTLTNSGYFEFIKQYTK